MYPRPAPPTYGTQGTTSLFFIPSTAPIISYDPTDDNTTLLDYAEIAQQVGFTKLVCPLNFQNFVHHAINTHGILDIDGICETLESEVSEWIESLINGGSHTVDHHQIKFETLQCYPYIEGLDSWLQILPLAQRLSDSPSRLPDQTKPCFMHDGFRNLARCFLTVINACTNKAKDVKLLKRRPPALLADLQAILPFPQNKSGNELIREKWLKPWYYFTRGAGELLMRLPNDPPIDLASMLRKVQNSQTEYYSMTFLPDPSFDNGEVEINTIKYKRDDATCIRFYEYPFQGSNCPNGCTADEIHAIAEKALSVTNNIWFSEGSYIGIDVPNATHSSKKQWEELKQALQKLGIQPRC